MQSPGPESWHPNPAFLFQEGAGPLWDIGPYYLTTLVQLFGPVAAVAGLGSKSREKRTIGSGPLAGTDFDVTVPTHVSAIARFESGQSSQSIFSFDSPLSRGGFVEITGSDATLAVPDPNGFDGEIKIRRRGADDWETIAEHQGGRASAAPAYWRWRGRSGRTGRTGPPERWRSTSST